MSPKDVFLGQGTLRPDLIESASDLASNKADAIKTHHNDTQLVRQLREQVDSIRLLCRSSSIRFACIGVAPPPEMGNVRVSA